MACSRGAACSPWQSRVPSAAVLLRKILAAEFAPASSQAHRKLRGGAQSSLGCVLVFQQLKQVYTLCFTLLQLDLQVLRICEFASELQTPSRANRPNAPSRLVSALQAAAAGDSGRLGQGLTFLRHRQKTHLRF